MREMVDGLLNVNGSTLEEQIKSIDSLIGAIQNKTRQQASFITAQRTKIRELEEKLAEQQALIDQILNPPEPKQIEAEVS